MLPAFRFASKPKGWSPMIRTLAFLVALATSGCSTFPPPILMSAEDRAAWKAERIEEVKRPEREWARDLEVALRSDDFATARNLARAREGVLDWRAVKMTHNDHVQNDVVVWKMIRHGETYAEGGRDRKPYCDLHRYLNNGVRLQTKYQFPKSVRDFVSDRCNELIAANNAAIQKAKDDEDAKWAARREAEDAEARARKVARAAKDQAAADARKSAIDKENSRVAGLGYSGVYTTRVAPVILNLVDRRKTSSELEGQLFGCGRLAKELGESCGGLDRNIQAIQVVDASTSLYSLDEWHGSTNYEFTILVRDNLEPGATVTGSPLPQGYYTLDGTQTYETALGATNTVYVIRRVE
jgi:hypothetical protein